MTVVYDSSVNISLCAFLRQSIEMEDTMVVSQSVCSASGLLELYNKNGWDTTHIADAIDNGYEYACRFIVVTTDCDTVDGAEILFKVDDEGTVTVDGEMYPILIGSPMHVALQWVAEASCDYSM